MKFLGDCSKYLAASVAGMLHGRRMLILGSFLLIAACADVSSVVANPGSVNDGRLADVLETGRAGYNVPALAAMIIEGGTIVEMKAVGTRVISHPEVVTSDDQWHLGSISKSMTCTLAAILIERGLLDWDSTVSDVLLDAILDMRNEYRNVRIEQLMAHTGGLPTDVTLGPSFMAGDFNDTSMIPTIEKRLMWSAELLRMAPATGVGTHFYGNANYIVLGAMIEKVTGEQREGLMQRELFAPLGMLNSGFGPPRVPGMRTQP